MARLPGDLLRDIHLGLGALPPADKAEVAEVLMDDLAAMGRVNDRDLAHITPAEALMLKEAGGAGTLNPETGLNEYYVPGIGSPGLGAVGTGSGIGFAVTSGGGYGGGQAGTGVAPAPTGGTAASTGSTTSSSSQSPNPFGWTSAEGQSIASQGEAATSPTFSFANTRGEGPVSTSHVPPYFDPLIDYDIVPELARNEAKNQELTREANYQLYLQKQKDNLFTQLIQQDTQKRLQDAWKDHSFIDRVKNIPQNPDVWREKRVTTDKEGPDGMYEQDFYDSIHFEGPVPLENMEFLQSQDGTIVTTKDGMPIEAPNMTMQNIINDYIYSHKNQNPTMYGLEKYYDPLPTTAEQLGFEKGAFDVLPDFAKEAAKETKEALANSWFSDGVKGVSNYVAETTGIDFSNTPLLSFLARSPIGVLKAFVTEMLEKQTPDLQDAKKMMLAAQTYVDKGEPIPSDPSVLSTHDFTDQPYLGEPSFRGVQETGDGFYYTKPFPTQEEVQAIRDQERMLAERRLKQYEAYIREQEEEAYRKRFVDTVPGDYYDLRKQETYQPIGIEKLLGNT